MSKRAFDILPPYQRDEPKSYHSHDKDKGKKEKKSLRTFFVFVFSLFFIFVLFSFAKINNFNFSDAKSGSTAQPTSNLELFDSQGQSNLSDQDTIVSVKLQDGSTKPENLGLVKDTLLKNGFEISSTEKSLITSNQTFVYYKKGEITKAQKASSALSPNFNVQIQESSSLSANYDLLVLIGNQ